MREHQLYYDLDSPIFLLGVPTGIFLTELALTIISLFMGKITTIKIVITLSILFSFHFTTAALFKWSPNWIEKILEYFSMPYTPVYKDNVAWVPSNRDFKD